jgi:hypothetical protein
MNANAFLAFNLIGNSFEARGLDKSMKQIWETRLLSVVSSQTKASLTFVIFDVEKFPKPSRRECPAAWPTSSNPRLHAPDPISQVLSSGRLDFLIVLFQMPLLSVLKLIITCD